MTSQNPHSDDILLEQAQYCGQRGIHYHEFLRAGENTLNFQLAKVLADSQPSNGFCKRLIFHLNYFHKEVLAKARASFQIRASNFFDNLP